MMQWMRCCTSGAPKVREEEVPISGGILKEKASKYVHCAVNFEIAQSNKLCNYSANPQVNKSDSN